MPKLPRIDLPGVSYHVGQRGHRRRQIFYGPSDFTLYLSLLTANAQAFGLDLIGYCLMPNHVHIACRPQRKMSLSYAMGQTSRSYSTVINRREGWTGTLWDGRFWSSPCDDEALYRVMAYIEMNPVRARLVAHPWEWAWSSAKSHVAGVNDQSLSEVWHVPPPEWRDFLFSLSAAECEKIRSKLSTGRPLGSPRFIETLQETTGRVLEPLKRGPRPKLGVDIA